MSIAAYETFMDVKNGNFSAGVHVLGLAERIDWALDENNASLVTADMKAAIESARADIIAGKVKVHDYFSDESCPY